MNSTRWLLSIAVAGISLAQTAPPRATPRQSTSEVTVRSVSNLPNYKALHFAPLKQVTIPTPETFTLPNGIKVFLLEHHELPLVSGFAMIRTGNLFDPPDKRGLAELTGTVLRSGGTAANTGDELDQTLENMAASVESNIGENRGSLSFSCLKENVDPVMTIFHDLLTSAAFRRDKVDLAKTQTRSAIARRNDDPSGIASREFSSILYGRDSPFGWNIEYEHIDHIQRQDLIDFYQRYYFPANITLAVYGDFAAAEMRARIERMFAAWDYKQPAVPTYPAFAAKAAPGIYLADRNDVTQTFFEIGHVGGLLRDKDYPALQVAANILGGGFTSRLVQKVRTELGYAYSINAGWGAGYLHPGLFEISGSTKLKSTVETIRTVGQELERLRKVEVTDEELKTAKDTVLNSFVFYFDTPAKTLNRIVSYEYYGYPTDFIFQFQKAIGTVTKADVLRVCREYLKPENLTIVAVGNPKEFGASLSTLGIPVHPLDLTIPEPQPIPGKPAVSKPPGPGGNQQ